MTDWRDSWSIEFPCLFNVISWFFCNRLKKFMIFSMTIWQKSFILHTVWWISQIFLPIPIDEIKDVLLTKFCNSAIVCRNALFCPAINRQNLRFFFYDRLPILTTFFPPIVRQNLQFFSWLFEKICDFSHDHLTNFVIVPKTVWWLSKFMFFNFQSFDKYRHFLCGRLTKFSTYVIFWPKKDEICEFLQSFNEIRDIIVWQNSLFFFIILS